ncbi:hypothetical protein [Paraburkholderia elongata]|uniref:Uncharacterized protein n=1 Tax=Paraburkholderia elongata TaxID=2675747 RepID=A0A972NSJ4_9BURK|nr:hypothetical protein [Paraburkholderia elongata]NPT59036.1 hypothetical protein [Paraburkholderia elongata]
MSDLIELIRDANREITPADRHAILDFTEAKDARITLLEQTLREIANADTAEWDDPGEFEGWAKGRARGALGDREG